MSVSGILSSAVFSLGANLLKSRMQKANTEFQQLGKDLQAGNLSAAQADFADLQQLRNQSTSTSSSQGSTTLTQDLKQLSTDLQAGDITSAQKDLAQYQKDLQSQPPTVRHHHGHGADITQLFNQLGTALQSGSLSSAQQAYAALQQDFGQFTQSSASSSVSFNA